jgi:hypothetical protein
MTGKIYSRFDSKVSISTLDIQIDMTDLLRDYLYFFLGSLRIRFPHLRCCYIFKDVHSWEGCGWHGRIWHCERRVHNSCCLHTYGKESRYSQPLLPALTVTNELLPAVYIGICMGSKQMFKSYPL